MVYTNTTHIHTCNVTCKYVKSVSTLKVVDLIAHDGCFFGGTLETQVLGHGLLLLRQLRVVLAMLQANHHPRIIHKITIIYWPLIF